MSGARLFAQVRWNDWLGVSLAHSRIGGKPNNADGNKGGQ
jgi:hypothetical protein